MTLRRIGLYSLIAFASLALVGLLAAGVSGALNRGDEARVETASTPTVSEPPEPSPAPQTRQKPEGEQPKERPGGEEREKPKQKNPEQAPSEQEPSEQEPPAQDPPAQAPPEKEPGPSFAAAASPDSLNLTVPALDMYEDPVTNSVSEDVLSNGAGKLPQTGFPWQQGANTYIAAHVYGYPGTGSWQQFAELPSMQQGDGIFLTDADGTTYEYRVSEILTVAPTDTWVAQSNGEDMVSLQTCVGPGWSERLVVRGEMVDSTPA